MQNTAMLSRHLFPNLFDPKRYYQLDVRAGVMRNMFGAKCCTFSGYALKGLYTGLKNETGPAWRLVLRRCGEIWGERFSQRFLHEIASFYQEDLEHMTMARFVALVEEYFAVAGWGRLRCDFSQIDAGVIVLEMQNEIMGDLLRESGERGGVLLEGVFTALFAAITGKEMECYETQSIAQGASTSTFVVSTKTRLRPVVAWIEAEMSHADIVKRLLEE